MALKSVALVLMLGSAIAVAQTPSSSNENATPAPGTGSGSGSADIAKPAPDAPPEKVEKAKEVAKAADLTPILPNPNNPTKPAYQLYAEIDVPIIAVGTVFALARLNRTGEHVPAAYCAPLCTSNNSPALNRVDELTKGWYSSSWSTASDFELYGMVVGGAALLISDEGVLNALNDGVVIGEATLSATAVSSIMTLAAGRPRPFLYGEKAPLSVRMSGDSALSFLSSHTSEAFAFVTSLYIAEKRLHPKTARPKIILGVGLGVASMIAVSRVIAGYHFISDVVGGAVVGSSLGILIGSVHGSPVQVIPVVNTDKNGTQSAGLGLSGTF